MSRVTSPLSRLQDDESPLKSSAAKSCWSQVAAPLKIVLGVVLGTVVGRVLAEQGLGDSDVVALLKLPGTLWLKALKCIVLPLVICSMITSMVTLRSLPDVRRVSIVFLLYLCTTVLAVLEGCIVSKFILGPSVMAMAARSTSSPEQHQEGGESQPTVPPMSPIDVFLNSFHQLVPGNIFKDAAEGKLLSVLVIAIVIGLLIPAKREDDRKSATLEVVEEVSIVTQRVVHYLMLVTPVGVGCLVLGSMATFDIDKAGGVVGVFMCSVAAGLAIHTFVVYPLMLLLLAGRNPIKYYANLVSPLLTAFGAASTAVALPLSIETAVEKNAIQPHLAKFVLTLGTTVNMDGTSLFLICSTYFLAIMEGVTFDPGMFASMALLATLCSIGMAPVPSASLVFLPTIMIAVGVPLSDSFGLLVAVDWFLDRLRTITNFSGDHVVCAIVDKYLATSEKAREDEDQMNARSSTPADTTCEEI